MLQALNKQWKFSDVKYFIIEKIKKRNSDCVDAELLRTIVCKVLRKYLAESKGV